MVGAGGNVGERGAPGGGRFSSGPVQDRDHLGPVDRRVRLERGRCRAPDDADRGGPAGGLGVVAALFDVGEGAGGGGRGAARPAPQERDRLGSRQRSLGGEASLAHAGGDRSVGHPRDPGPEPGGGVDIAEAPARGHPDREGAVGQDAQLFDVQQTRAAVLVGHVWRGPRMEGDAMIAGAVDEHRRAAGSVDGAAVGQDGPRSCPRARPGRTGARGPSRRVLVRLVAVAAVEEMEAATGGEHGRALHDPPFPGLGLRGEQHGGRRRRLPDGSRLLRRVGLVEGEPGDVEALCPDRVGGRADRARRHRVAPGPGQGPHRDQPLRQWEVHVVVGDGDRLVVLHLPDEPRVAGVVDVDPGVDRARRAVAARERLGALVRERPQRSRSGGHRDAVAVLRATVAFSNGRIGPPLAVRELVDRGRPHLGATAHRGRPARRTERVGSDGPAIEAGRRQGRQRRAAGVRPVGDVGAAGLVVDHVRVREVTRVAGVGSGRGLVVTRGRRQRGDEHRHDPDRPQSPPCHCRPRSPTSGGPTAGRATARLGQVTGDGAAGLGAVGERPGQRRGPPRSPGQRLPPMVSA